MRRGPLQAIAHGAPAASAAAPATATEPVVAEEADAEPAAPVTTPE